MVNIYDYMSQRYIIRFYYAKEITKKTQKKTTMQPSAKLKNGSWATTQVRAWNGEAFPKDHRWSDDIITKDRW